VVLGNRSVVVALKRSALSQRAIILIRHCWLWVLPGQHKCSKRRCSAL